MRQVKLIQYNTIEVEAPPKQARELRIPCEIGGYYTCFILERLDDTFTLWIGSGEEPTFRIEHKFKTWNEAVYYAQYIWNAYNN